MKPSAGERTLLGVAGLCALVLAATPWWLLPVCEAFGSRLRTATGAYVPMRCTYSANVLVAVGVLTVLLAAVGAMSRSREAFRLCALALACMFALALMVPTKIVGVCAGPTHPCHAGTLPAVMAAAGAGLALAAVAGVLSWRLQGRASCEAQDQS